MCTEEHPNDTLYLLFCRILLVGTIDEEEMATLSAKESRSVSVFINCHTLTIFEACHWFSEIYFTFYIECW